MYDQKDILVIHSGYTYTNIRNHYKTKNVVSFVCFLLDWYLLTRKTGKLKGNKKPYK